MCLHSRHAATIWWVKLVIELTEIKKEERDEKDQKQNSTKKENRGWLMIYIFAMKQTLIIQAHICSAQNQQVFRKQVACLSITKKGNGSDPS